MSGRTRKILSMLSCTKEAKTTELPLTEQEIGDTQDTQDKENQIRQKSATYYFPDHQELLTLNELETYDVIDGNNGICQEVTADNSSLLPSIIAHGDNTEPSISFETPLTVQNNVVIEFVNTGNYNDLIYVTSDDANILSDTLNSVNNSNVKYQIDNRGTLNSIGNEEEEEVTEVITKKVETVKRNLNDIFNENTDISEKRLRKSRKKIATRQSWKRNVVKVKRLAGETYIGRGGKQVNKKVLKEACQCSKRCATKVTEKERDTFFRKFWRKDLNWDMRRQIVLDCIKCKSIERRRPTTSTQKNRRQHSYVYFLKVADQSPVSVCKNMFLSTVGVSEKFVRNALRGVGEGDISIASPDKRSNHLPTNKISELAVDLVKKHVSLFPVVESHYRRATSERQYLDSQLNISTMYKYYTNYCNEQQILPENIVKESFYRYVFNTHFNISFKTPAADTCDDCDYFYRKIVDAKTDSVREEATKEREEHHTEAENRYTLKQQDKKRSRLEGSCERVCTVDLQKCLPTPNLSNARSFYCLKLWTFNFTMTDMTTKKTTCFIWNESLAGRGSNEIASCITKWIEALPENIDKITIWSDNCSGQNRNVNIIFAYFWLLHKYPRIKEINHKYLLKGHTHMEVDIAHSVIERKKKNSPTMEISTTHDWAQVIKMASSNNPYIVVEMTLSDFKTFASLGDRKTSPFVNRKKDIKTNEEKRITQGNNRKKRNAKNCAATSNKSKKQKKKTKTKNRVVKKNTLLQGNHNDNNQNVELSEQDNREVNQENENTESTELPEQQDNKEVNQENENTKNVELPEQQGNREVNQENEKTDKSSKEDFKISEVVHLRFESKSIGTVQYKTKFDQTDFKTINLLRVISETSRGSEKIPKEVPQASLEKIPKDTKKYRHLMDLLRWVPESCKSFFLELPHAE